MSEESKCFTFIWKIKNSSLIPEGKYSPSFFVQAMGETKWRLVFYTKSKSFKDCVACYFCRAEDDRGPDQYELDFELAFLSGDGSVLHSEKYLPKVYKRCSTHSMALIMKRDEVYILKKDLFIPDDILTIRCRMWDSQKPISRPGRCFAETSLETECKTFIGIIKKFSNIETSCKNLISIHSSQGETFLSSMNLCVTADDKFIIEIKPVGGKSFDMWRSKIFIRDVIGNKIKCGQGELCGTQLQCTTLTLLKEHLMENKDYYLPNDVLTLECDVIFSTGKVIEKIDEPEYGFDYENTQKMLSNATKTNLYSIKDNIENLTILKDDWISLFREGILCDTALKTATETFPAHTVVLSARSPVFKSMFATDMKERTNKCVDIDDLDADTVRRMLLFMYSATLDDLQYESTKSLYFAADKYNIVSLKHRCSDFLKLNLMVSNCCDILLLADKHQDTKLKSAVQDYIAENDEAVLISDEWKNLEKNHPQLTIEVFRFIYMKIRINQGHIRI